MINTYCSLCMSCSFDCKTRANINNCVNYEKMISLNEINDMIREQNVNLKRFAKENNLKYYILMDYLKSKRIIKYKYYKLLLDRLMEKECYIPYLDDMEVGY